MAEEVTSGLIYTQIDGSDTFFRTKVTFDGTRVRKNEIQQSVSEDDYNNLSSDQKGGEIENFYFKIVKIDDDYTSLATESVQKSLSSYDLRKQTDGASLDALETFARDNSTDFVRSDFAYNFSTQLNVADDAGDANDGGGSLPQVEFNPVEDRFGVTDNRKTEYENLFYPEDIATSRQDRIRFTMFYQSGRSFNFNLNAGGADDLFTFGDRNIKTINGSVTLPIQGGISDTNAVQYSDSELSPIQAAGAGIILNPNEAFQSASQLFQGGAEAFQNMLSSPEVQNIVNALKVTLAGTAVGANLTARTTGAILNPNLELLLNKPSLREFEFKFRMSARDRKEASQIRKIIRFFKMGMSVKKSNTSLFIVSPNQFRIQYLAGGEGNISKDHPSIGKIKECALTSLNTNYTPDNTYMTFDDEARTMTSYEITMRFKELTPLTESDYLETAAREDSIGY